MTVALRNASPALRVRRLGLAGYEPVWRDMRRFCDERDATTPDELWLLEHPPVYTLGLKAHGHPGGLANIPVVATDRGGDITYHGPGQLVAYTLVDLGRRRLGVKSLVHLLEQAAIDVLSGFRIDGERRPGAPGVYVAGRKIAQLGLRIRRGASYHGLSLNVAMDLAPFRVIRPCGYQGLEVTQLSELVDPVACDIKRVRELLAARLANALGDAPARTGDHLP